MWAEHQEQNQTPVNLFNGITDVVNKFARLPHGVCSQNSQSNIRNVLSTNQINAPFKAIVGYDDVSNGHQKPDPFGGIKCIKSIFGHTDKQLLMYIGDHEADTQFARNIEQHLGGSCKVIAVAAAYSGAQPKRWNAQPDYVAHQVEDLLSIIGKYA